MGQRKEKSAYPRTRIADIHSLPPIRLDLILAIAFFAARPLFSTVNSISYPGTLICSNRKFEKKLMNLIYATESNSYR